MSAQLTNEIRLNFSNQHLNNPSQTAIGQNLRLSLTHQNNFSDIPGAPSIQTASIQYPFVEQNMGLGLSIFQESAGLLDQRSAVLNYMYKVKTGFFDNDYFSIGLGLSLNQFGINTDRLNSSVELIDNTLPDIARRSLSINTNIGLTYSTYDGEIDEDYYLPIGFTFGIATGKAIPNNISIEQLNFRESRFYHALGRVDFTGNEDLMFSALAEYTFIDELNSDIRIATQATLGQSVIFSLGYDTNGFIHLEIGGRLLKSPRDQTGLTIMANGSIPCGDLDVYTNNGIGFKVLYDINTY